MPPGEEIDMGGIFDFVRLNIKAQNTIRTRTLAMARVLGDNEERKIGLFRRLLRTMCAETGKQEKSLQSRLDACKLSVHCLYDIALNDASEAKLVNFKRCLLVISLFAKSSPSVFSADHMTSLEPYLKTSAEKEDQEIAYLVVVIYRTILGYGQLTFQPEFLTRAMTTIATGMTSASLKVYLILTMTLMKASQGGCTCCVPYCSNSQRLFEYHQSRSDLLPTCKKCGKTDCDRWLESREHHFDPLLLSSRPFRSTCQNR